MTSRIESVSSGILRCGGRTVIGAEPLRLAQELRVRPEEPLVHGRLQLQAEVGLAGHRLRQYLREGLAASSAGMPAVSGRGV